MVVRKKDLCCNIIFLVIFLSGCSKYGGLNDTQEQSPYQDVNDEYQYVSEYIYTLKQGYITNPYVFGDAFYFCTNGTSGTQGIYRMQLAESTEPEKLPAWFEEKGNDLSVRHFLMDSEGNFYFLLDEYSVIFVASSNSLEMQTLHYFSKYSPTGEELFWYDITELLSENGVEDIEKAALDAENHLYVAEQEKIFIFDGDGSLLKAINTEKYILGMGTGKDGKVYCKLSSPTGSELWEIDIVSGKLGQVYNNYPYGYQNWIVPGLEGDFLVYDQSNIYEYDMSTQSSDVVVNWVDANLFGNDIYFAAAMEDGNILVLENERSGNFDLYVLTKKPVSQIVEKKVIQVGTIYSNINLERLAVAFNRRGTEYRIEVRTYYNSNGDLSYNEALTAMNMDFITGNGPDIFSTQYGNTANYASKGLIEDLTPYLKKSTVLNYEDFIEPVLNAVTYNGILTCIPPTFTLQTLAGRSDQVGKDMGWSLEEMIAFLEEYPDKQVLDVAGGIPIRPLLVSLFMSYNQSAFVDWEAGTCSFDSEEFGRILELISRFPESYPQSDRSEGTLLAEGDVLLAMEEISNPNMITGTFQKFGDEEFTYIGYPTLDGCAGCKLEFIDGAYAISTQSQNKEGAWKFIEFMLLDPSGIQETFGFSSMKEKLEQQFAEASKEPYMRDENGEVIPDSKGEPMRRTVNYGLQYWDGFHVEFYALLPEEEELLREMIDIAKPSDSDNVILSIITEEVESYFQGQKSLKEVQDVIQSRAGLYISEGY